MDFPVLSVIVFTPIVAGILILLIPADRKTEIRVTALAAAHFRCCYRSGYISHMICRSVVINLLKAITGCPVLGISYIVGVDGMNAPLVLLTGIVMFTGVLISWGIDDRHVNFLPSYLSWHRCVWCFCCPGFIHVILLL